MTADPSPPVIALTARDVKTLRNRADRGISLLALAGPPQARYVVRALELVQALSDLDAAMGAIDDLNSRTLCDAENRFDSVLAELIELPRRIDA